MKLIDISNSKHPNTFTMVDDADYEWLIQWKWIMLSPRCMYAVRWNPEKKTGCIYMHREIIKTGGCVDHIDMNKLNNQRSNLRIATPGENQRHKGLLKSNTSGLIGVSWHDRDKIWHAGLRFNGRRVFRKRGRDPIALAMERDEAARKYHGEFAVLNFPDKGGA